ncbi:hypothetical protein Tco_0221514 [Tanacetum coccineum]
MKKHSRICFCFKKEIGESIFDSLSILGSVVQMQKGYDWDEEALSFEYDEFNSIKVLMTLVEDEPSYGKNDARPRQWVDITFKKEH